MGTGNLAVGSSLTSSFSHFSMEGMAVGSSSSSSGTNAIANTLLDRGSLGLDLERDNSLGMLEDFDSVLLDTPMGGGSASAVQARASQLRHNQAPTQTQNASRGANAIGTRTQQNAQLHAGNAGNNENSRDMSNRDMSVDGMTSLDRFLLKATDDMPMTPALELSYDAKGNGRRGSGGRSGTSNSSSSSSSVVAGATSCGSMYIPGSNSSAGAAGSSSSFSGRLSLDLSMS